ncbi:hypothetical protein [Paenibacillus woosongensis]|uniref:Uncharacterized protein n=1 Tax=Paenibacillus woosongensis TaxID=307580 RepID=A0A7X2Z0R7_9BACL|nr:hypothetical protein [Paenibacillus woosongensis]MUG45482.1 hypothetical protein [Paenibacillus woosongensis]
MANPQGITYKAEYEPDMERMVEALKIVKEAPLPKKDDSNKQDELQEGA